MSSLDRSKRKGSSVRHSGKLQIFTEGELTEIDYFKNVIKRLCEQYGLVADYNNVMLRISLNSPTNGSMPMSILDSAISAKALERIDNDGNLDSYFVVFDEDDRDIASLRPVFEKARKKDNKIEVCFSNRCFEFWALLHFEYTCAPHDKEALYKAVKIKMPSYSATRAGKKLFECEKMFADSGIEKAVKNAIRLRKEQAENNGKGSPDVFDVSYEYPRPWTNVDYLIMTIKHFMAYNYLSGDLQRQIFEEIKEYNRSCQNLYHIQL